MRARTYYLFPPYLPYKTIFPHFLRFYLHSVISFLIVFQVVTLQFLTYYLLFSPFMHLFSLKVLFIQFSAVCL